MHGQRRAHGLQSAGQGPCGGRSCGHPRTGWKTAITEQAEYDTFSAPVTIEEGFWGKNRCAIDAAEPNHWLHHYGGPTAGWEVAGYQVTQISEKGAPFDGFFYLDSQNLRISRQIWINDTLESGGPTAKLNASGPDGNPADFAAYVQMIQTHEQIHSDLVKEYFASLDPSDDPANQVEPYYALKKDDLTLQADMTIRTTESILQDESSEAAVQARLRTMDAFNRAAWILAPDFDGTNKAWQIHSLAAPQGTPN